MRISTSQVFNQGLQELQRINTDQARTQKQVATGKKILNPSDDPVASTRITQLKQQLAQGDQFVRNAELSKTRLERQDGVLSGFTESLARARELTIRAGDGALSKTDRESVATELRQVLDQMVSLANTRDAQGEYIFGGFRGEEAPFQKDISGNIEYRGDEGQRSVEIDNDVFVPVNDNGKQTFGAIPSDRPTFSTSANPRNEADPPARISTGVVTDRETFEEFYPDDLVVRFEKDGAGNTTYSVSNRDTGRVLVEDEPYTSGSPIQVEGVRFEVSGNPADGDSFFVETSQTQSVFGTMEKLIAGLETHPDNEAGRTALKDTVDQALANIDNAETRVLEVQSGVGTRLNTVESTVEFLKDSELLSRETLSDLEDLDYAEAISRLTQQNFVLQAAQQSFAQISRLSLFDSL